MVRRLHLSRKVLWGANNYILVFDPLLIPVSFDLALVVWDAAVPVR